MSTPDQPTDTDMPELVDSTPHDNEALLNLFNYFYVSTGSHKHYTINFSLNDKHSATVSITRNKGCDFTDSKFTKGVIFRDSSIVKMIFSVWMDLPKSCSGQAYISVSDLSTLRKASHSFDNPKITDLRFEQCPKPHLILKIVDGIHFYEFDLALAF